MTAVKPDALVSVAAVSPGASPRIATHRRRFHHGSHGLPQVTFITKAGEEVVAEAHEDSLMRIANDHDVEGITGDCGGVCSCATCHVHVDPAWADRVGPATDPERDLLELEDNFNDRSRLGCQVRLTPELDGLVVRVATPD